MNDELLVKYLLGEITPAQQKAVEAWVNASPENTGYFDHFRLIWETSKQIVLPPNVNADDAWKRFQQRTETAVKKPAVLRPLNASLKWIRVAAVVLISVGALSIAYFLVTRESRIPIIISSTLNVLNDTLPDGSIVMLNKNSHIKYAPTFSGKKRMVDLKGEAFFIVNANKEKPFVISVEDITVTVVGTSFNIKSYGGKTQVVVESGVVQVTKNNKTIELQPNEKLTTQSTDSVFSKEKLTDKLHQYYRSKEFVCDNTPLWKLVEVLNEAYQANIVIEKKELQTLPLTTTFYNESLDNILSIISETFDITVEYKGNRIILK